MSEAEERARVVAEARTWIGTPFNDCSDVKGAGVDCAMMVTRCFVDCAILEPFDPRPYPRHGHLHSDEERFLSWFDKLGVRTGELKPANVMIFKEGRVYSHCGIITENGNLVHASYRLHKVMESPLFQSDLNFLANGSPRPKLIFDPWARRC